MGNYATIAQLKTRFEDDEALAHVTHNEDAGTADTAVLTEALNNAEGYIDSALAKRYEVPVDVSLDDVVAARLKSIALDIAVHNLVTGTDFESEAKQRAYDDAKEWLKAVAKGEWLLPSATTLATTATDDPLIAYGTAGESDSSKRLFSRATQDNL